MNSIIGKRIKELRKANGLTQLELATHIGIVQHTLSGYEKSISQPDIETLEKLAVYFSVSTDFLLGITEQDSKSNQFSSKLINYGQQLNNLNKDIIIGEMARMIDEQNNNNNTVAKEKTVG